MTLQRYSDPYQHFQCLELTDAILLTCANVMKSIPLRKLLRCNISTFVLNPFHSLTCLDLHQSDIFDGLSRKGGAWFPLFKVGTSVLRNCFGIRSVVVSNLVRFINAYWKALVIFLIFDFGFIADVFLLHWDFLNPKFFLRFWKRGFLGSYIIWCNRIKEKRAVKCWFIRVYRL